MVTQVKQNSRMFHMKERLLLRPQLSGVPALILHHTVFILLLTCAGESSQPIVAMMGDDIVLPCQMEHAVDASSLTVEWSRPDLEPRFVHLRRDSVELVLEKNQLYKGRTSLSTNRLKRGDISMKLSTVKVSDEGTYRGYVPSGTPTDCVVQLTVGSVSFPDIKISKVSNGVLLVCKSEGWYPEPEVFWLDGEGNLLSAGPTETVRGPDDLYTVSSRVTVEKRHSNSFTCRVQQNSTNQIRETKIHVPDDFFEVQSSSSSTTVGFAVSLAVCILVILILGFFVWSQKKINQTDLSKLNDTEYQVVTEGEPERQQLLTHETVQMKDLNKGQAAGIRPEEEKLRRREAEKIQKTLKRELESMKTEIRKKRSDLQQLDEEKKKKEENVKRLKEQLENKNTEDSKKEKEKKKTEAEKEVENLKQQLETEEKELDTKTKEFDEKQVEVQQLQEEIQKKETNLKSLTEKLQSNNKELPLVTKKKLKEEQQRREEAENRVQILEKELQKKNREVDGLKDEVNKFKEEKKRSEKERQELQNNITEWENKFKEEEKKRERAEEDVKKLREVQGES